MVEIDIIAGFLGSGKTTFINKVLSESPGVRIALIENEIGDEAVDDYLVSKSGLEVRTLAAGCICCSLKVSLAKTLQALVKDYHLDRIIIEPTGIASPEEVIAACMAASRNVPVEVASVITIVNTANLERMVTLGIPAFTRQLEQARIVVLSHVDSLHVRQIERAKSMLSDKLGASIPLIAKPWGELDSLEVIASAEMAYLSSKAQVAHSEHGHHEKHRFDTVTIYPSAAAIPATLSHMEKELADEAHGRVLRAKGFLKSEDDNMLHVEYVYGDFQAEPSRYQGKPKLVIIGEQLDADFFRSARFFNLS